MDRKELARNCEYEAHKDIEFAEAAAKMARAGDIGEAFNLLDVAQVARRCAFNAMENLMSIAQGYLTSMESESMCIALAAKNKIAQVVETIQEARST